MYILLFVLRVVVLFILHRLYRSLRRRLRHAPFPTDWTAILARHLKCYPWLPEALQRELEGHIQIFLAEKNMEGCGGLELTDEIRVTVAAQACILLLNRKATYYPKLYSILVYPSAYLARKFEQDGDRHVESLQARLGESWNSGAVVLAWDAVRQGAHDIKDGHNVVLHEFAHQLDQEDGAADGAPLLEQRSSYVAWARVLGEEYAELQDDAHRRSKNVMDYYGATNPAEFFAVVTETFFEKAWQLRKKHPKLYEQFKAYYQVDPAEWRKAQGRDSERP